MSNFICSECGMNNIDCGYAGYKTPKEIELEKQIERLQEQLDIAKTGIEFVKDVLVENKDSGVLWDMVNGYLKATLDKIEEIK